MSWNEQPQTTLIDVDERKDSLLAHFEPSKHTLPDAHFVEWFSGTDLDVVWDQRHPVGSGTIRMSDLVDEGLEIITGTTANSQSVIEFDTLRQYSENGCVVIGVGRAVEATNRRVFMGLNRTLSFADSYAFISNGTVETNWALRTRSDAVAETITESSIPTDEVFHYGKMQLDGTTGTLHLDGILEATKTNTLPDNPMNPMCTSRSLGSAARTCRFRYYEAYNT